MSRTEPGEPAHQADHVLLLAGAWPPALPAVAKELPTSRAWLPNSSRRASTVAESGFHSATVPVQRGMVPGGTARCGAS
ncbi:hypothetical protein N566_04550 [Streptomycetaceae bacterium MP113-05]|nr:hypothetical protein N566_04550 [Streptomycetaceae bacterium MP113-05]